MRWPCKVRGVGGGGGGGGGGRGVNKGIVRLRIIAVGN